MTSSPETERVALPSNQHNEDSELHVPARNIPVPTSISPEAQAFMAGTARYVAARSAPGQAEQAAAAVEFLRPAANRFSGTFETLMLPQGVQLYRATPIGREGRHVEVAYMEIHGGGFVAGGGQMCQMNAKNKASLYGLEVYSPDYRLAPEYPFPAALDDCMTAYREILRRYKGTDLVVGGASAGGNLAAALLLRAREEGLPLPAALVLMTPVMDMTCAGDSHQTNRYLDVALYGWAEGGGPEIYAAGHDLTAPHLSPLFGSFSRDWPPTILTTGTRDLFLSDTVRMHRKLRRAGVHAELHVVEAGSHVGFMGLAPEDTEILAECRRFVYAMTGIKS